MSRHIRHKPKDKGNREVMDADKVSGEMSIEAIVEAARALQVDSQSVGGNLTHAESAVIDEAGSQMLRQSEIATLLGVNSKRVDTWRTRSAVNGFPDPAACHFGTTTGGGKQRHNLWDSGVVLAWYRGYDETRQRARGGTSQRGRKWDKEQGRWIGPEESR